MARQSRVEGAIRDCMKAQGFDYVPVDPFAQRAAVTGAARLSDEDFLKQFGYGISTLWGRGDAQADPNERIRDEPRPGRPARLRPRALGREPGRDLRGGRRQRRLHEARRLHARRRPSAVFGGAPGPHAAPGQARPARRAHPRGPAHGARRSRSGPPCMADAGYRYEDPDEIDSDITKRIREDRRPGARPVRHRRPPEPSRRRTTTPRSPRCSATRWRPRAPTSTASSRTSRRSRPSSGRSTRRSSASRTRGCWRGCARSASRAHFLSGA